MEKVFWVYIMARRKEGTLYTGLTSDLVQRVWQHKNSVFKRYTSRYGVDRLVWFELHEEFDSACDREKKIKRWRRAWKYALIEERNPEWRDLYPDIL